MTKILVAEDERDIRELIAFTLQFAGYEVELATNGEEAVALAPKIAPALVLMDVRMPKMTGYEACALLRQKPEMEGIPIVFLSAKGQESEINEGLKAGAEEYILKPFAPDELIKQVKQILTKYGKS
ncbi:MAG: response regulator [Anaerolineae bacterium]|nr:response regulator [Anaerolineae bacterium]